MKNFECLMCPRMCRVDRKNQFGYCGEGLNPRIALVSLHKWEEPCLVGNNGAGTIFFSGCSMRCCYCQNFEISQRGGFGIEVTIDRLAEIFIEQQNRGAENLDLVTPTHFSEQIIESLKIARKENFMLPVVYNSSGYENIETLEKLRGFVDIFLPDLKYYSDSTAEEFSNAPNYFETATRAIKKMFELVGEIELRDGILKRGMIVRHLILPNHRKESLKILDWLFENFQNKIFVSLMRQYVPMKNVPSVISRRLTTFEYDSVVEHAIKLGFENIFVQEKDSAKAEFIPVFDGTNI